MLAPSQLNVSRLISNSIELIQCTNISPMSVSWERRRLLLVALVMAAACGTGIVGLLTGEPTIEGRTVRSLVRQAAHDSQFGSTNNEALAVFRRNGGKAAAALAQIMAPTHPSFLRSLARALTERYWLECRLPAWLRTWTQRTVVEADTRERDRESAVVWCASLGPQASPAHPALLAACRDLDASVREAGVKSLARTEVPARIAVPLLSQRLLQDSSGSVRAWAAFYLGLFGEKAEAAIPALCQATNDPFWLTPSRAREALLRIETARATKSDAERVLPGAP